MKKIKSLILVLLTAVVLVFTTASDNFEKNSSGLTITGSLTNGDPDLSWTSYTGAASYQFLRAPAPILGGSSKYFEISVSANGSFLDETVNGAALGVGFKQVRYRINALDSFGNVLATDAVDYTADSID